MVIRLLTKPEVEVFQKQMRLAITQALGTGRMAKEEARFERAFVSQPGLHYFRGARCYGLLTPAGLVMSLNATSFSKTPRKDAWGKYVNFYLAYTLPPLRKQGYASQLQAHVEGVARSEGYSRLRSLIQSWGGFKLHERMGHQYWGVNEKGEISVDTPLSDEVFPEGVPRRARYAVNYPFRLDGLSLSAILRDPNGLFKQGWPAVDAMLHKRLERA